MMISQTPSDILGDCPGLVGDKRPGSRDDTVREYNTGTGVSPVPTSRREAKATYADVVKRADPNSAGRRNTILSSAHSLERIPLI